MPLPTKKAYIVAVDMGYGHQRAVFPLLDISTTPTAWNMTEPCIISANDYPGIPRSDKIKWFLTRKFYESVSRFQGFPLFGKRVFHLMSYLQRIPPFYPRRDLSGATFPVRFAHWFVRRGLGRHLVGVLNENPLPLISSFPLPALAAEEHGYKGDIYCLCTNTDIARAWVPLHPETSRIVYLAPTLRTRERLKLYGVRSENIAATGFPLPREAEEKEGRRPTLPSHVRARLAHLDPSGGYHKKFEKMLALYAGSDPAPESEKKPLSVTFAIGGAGAQSRIALQILDSFADDIRLGKVRLNLVAGTSLSILKRFERAVRKLSLESYGDGRVNILYSPDKYEYFRKFNALLGETDVLWTKPSELSFYAALGLPIVMSPSLGSQEEFNQSWLHMMGAGFEQYDPQWASEWLMDWIESGWLAEAAMNGWQNASRRGADNIRDLVLYGKKTEIEDVHFV